MRKVDQAKHDEKRRQVLEAALECFSRDGFRGASIADICAAAHMSPGHLYHYFDSKAAIVRAMVELGLEQSAALFEKLVGDINVVDALVAELDYRLKRNRRRVSFALEMLAESTRNRATGDIVRRHDQVRCELLSRLLQEGQKRGQVDPDLDPDTAAAIASSVVESMGYLAVRDPSFDMERGVAMLKVLLTRLLKPGEPGSAKRGRMGEAQRTSAGKRKLQPAT